jgi:hypothetical protein
VALPEPVEERLRHVDNRSNGLAVDNGGRRGHCVLSMTRRAENAEQYFTFAFYGARFFVR